MKIEELKALEAKATQGEWSIPHLSRSDVDCDCAYILAEGYCGSIAEISIDNGKPISDGGNDSPKLNEAQANGELITALRNNAKALIACAAAGKELLAAEEVIFPPASAGIDQQNAWANRKLAARHAMSEAMRQLEE